MQTSKILIFIQTTISNINSKIHNIFTSIILHLVRINEYNQNEIFIFYLIFLKFRFIVIKTSKKSTR